MSLLRLLVGRFNTELFGVLRVQPLAAELHRCLRPWRSAEALPLLDEIWPGRAMKLAGPLNARLPGLRLALAREIERHCSADEILQGRLIDLLAFMDVDGAPDIPVEAGVE